MTSKYNYYLNKDLNNLPNNKINRFVKDENEINNLLKQGYRFGFNSNLRKRGGAL